MKTINEMYEFVQEEMQDNKKIMFNKTKSELFYFLLAVFLTVEVGLYFMLH